MSCNGSHLKSPEQRQAAVEMEITGGAMQATFERPIAKELKSLAAFAVNQEPAVCGGKE